MGDGTSVVIERYENDFRAFRTWAADNGRRYWGFDTGPDPSFPPHDSPARRKIGWQEIAPPGRVAKRFTPNVESGESAVPSPAPQRGRRFQAPIPRRPASSTTP